MIKSWLTAPSYELQKTALISLCVSFKDNMGEYLVLTKGVAGTRGNNVGVTHAYMTLLNGSKSTHDIILYTSSKHGFLTRMYALEVIDAFSIPLNENLLSNCFQGVFQGNRKWRSMAITYLKKGYADSDKQKAILTYIEAHKSDWQDWQQQRVNRIFNLEQEQK